MKTNFKTFTKAEVIGLLKMEAYECWNNARGESINETKMDYIRMLPDSMTFKLHEVKDIMQIDGWKILKAYAREYVD